MVSEKVLFITGASSDVGIALINQIINEYHLVIAQYLHLNDGLRSLKERYNDKLQLLEADLSKQEDLQQLINSINSYDVTVDHIVHLASLKAQNSQFRKENWSKVENQMEVSTKSIYVLLQNCLPKMAKQKYGKVIFMLSSYVVGLPPKFQSSYIVSKYALLGLMKSLSVEYINYGITINGISPDMMETKFLSDLPHWIPEQNANESLLGRNLYVEDVIPTFVYLLSDGTDSITGQNFEIRNRV